MGAVVVMLLTWLRALLGMPDSAPARDALDDDVLDAWLDEDEIGSSGL